MQMLSLKSVETKIKSNISEFKDKKYLLAVSGGADSMVLTHIFKDLSLKFEIAHINYKLRGEDSELDMKTVQNFCEKFNIKFHLYQVSAKDKKPENSVQLWARDLRYRFFRKIQDKENIDFLVTAHHLNDQLETFIINLSKASGINGLSGIPFNENKILRPFLDFTKDEIYAFAEKNNIDFREDLSNKKNDYLRNRIRNEITPKLLETNENFLQNFKKSLDFLNQSKDFIDYKIKETEEKLTIFNSEYKILSKEKLAEESEFIQFEILKKYGFNKPEEIAKIFNSENGSTFKSDKYQIIIHREQLIITEKFKSQDTIQTKTDLIKSSDFSLDKNLIDLNEFLESTEEIDKEINWSFDAEKLHFPLTLRKPEDGDEFYPIGFSGKKKVSKFLRDEKLSILARQKIWLLCDAENSVLGVIPMRQDRRFSANENTEKILLVKK